MAILPKTISLVPGELRDELKIWCEHLHRQQCIGSICGRIHQFVPSIRPPIRLWCEWPWEPLSLMVVPGYCQGPGSKFVVDEGFACWVWSANLARKPTFTAKQALKYWSVCNFPRKPDSCGSGLYKATSSTEPLQPMWSIIHINQHGK